MKIFFGFLITFIAFFNAACGQKAAKAAYVQLGGPGLASVNFDTRFTPREDGIGGRIGIGGFSIDDVSILTLPVGVNYLIGKDQKNYFEIGAGFTYINGGVDDISSDNFSESYGNLTFGYRLAPAAGGFFFKAEITPVFGKGFFLPYFGGVGFGYKF